MTVSGNKVVTPKNNALHQQYTFYVKVTNDGGSYQFMGPYTLNIGCFSGMGVTFTHNSNMVLTLQKSVLAPTAAAYTFAEPTSSHAWCVIEKNEIADTSNNLWSAKLVANGAQPTTTFDLVSTAVSETYSFKIKTTFTNSMVLNS
jgi:hypothetical protein